MESVLTTIKAMLGISESDTSFDDELVVLINAEFMTLHQLGIGPATPAYIMGSEFTWKSVLGDTKEFEAVKTYIYIKVKLVFDPPAGSVADALKRRADELEWRLLNQVETKEE